MGFLSRPTFEPLQRVNRHQIMVMSRVNDMLRISLSRSNLASQLRSITAALGALLVSCLDGARGKYRPEDHYMRGPGPKWRAKHPVDGSPASRS